jgi:hypothetical protein
MEYLGYEPVYTESDAEFVSGGIDSSLAEA